MKLTKQQIKILEDGGANGISIKYETVWLRNGKPVTRTVKTLIKRGLLDAMYFSGGRAAANITDAGRKALIEVRTIL